MAKGKTGRILDKDFEDGIRNRAGEFQRDAQNKVGKFQREAQNDIILAREYAYEKNDEVEAMIREHPKSFVLGSFVGGFVLGTLFSKVNK
jgi:hypothetical protein